MNIAGLRWSGYGGRAAVAGLQWPGGSGWASGEVAPGGWPCERQGGGSGGVCDKEAVAVRENGLGGRD
jgi:hypothetical protein